MHKLSILLTNLVSFLLYGRSALVVQFSEVQQHFKCLAQLPMHTQCGCAPHKALDVLCFDKDVCTRAALDHVGKHFLLVWNLQASG